IVSGWLAEGRPPFSFGYVNLPALLVLGVVASLVAPAGAALAHRLPARALQTVFAVYLVVIGGRMLWQSLAG
ncbi:MAG: TSUP family transporter, partial [Cucumibacter sp.]